MSRFNNEIMPTTPTIESLSLQVVDYTNKYDAALDALPSQTDFASVRQQVASNTTNINDLSTNYYRNASNIGRIDILYSTLPKQTDFAALQRKINDLSSNITNTVTSIISSDSQLNTLIVNKLSDSATFIQAAQNIIENQGTIVSKTNLTDAINTLSQTVTSTYFTISGGNNVYSITRELSSSIFDLSISRVTIAKFNELDSRVRSLITTAASITNPTGIISEINRRALASDLSSTNASLYLTNTSLTDLSSYTNTINTNLSGLQTYLESNYSTTAQITSSIDDISSNINTFKTNIYSDLSSNIRSTLQQINELSQNTIKLSDFSGLSAFTNSISVMLYTNISDINISSIITDIDELSSNISTNIYDISSLYIDISSANRHISDISTNFNKYYTSSQVDDISFAINTEINYINSKYTTLQAQLLIPGISLNNTNSTFSISGQYTAQQTLQINIPNDTVQWLYIEMKGGDGDFCGNRNTSFNHGEIITGYIPIMPYDIINFYPGQKANTVISSIQPLTTYIDGIYNGITAINNEGTSGIKLASGAASILEINGTPVLVARGGTGSDGKQIGGGAAHGIYTIPKRDNNQTNKYFNQIIDLSQSYNTIKATTPSDGYIKYAFYTSLNKPQFSFRYRSADMSGIDSTYIDEHANFIVGSDIAPRRLMVNGLLDISGAIKNSIINAMPTGITLNAPTTLNSYLTINNADKSGNIYINTNGELVATAKDIRLLSTDLSLNNYTFSTIKGHITAIETTYAKRTELDTAQVNINGVKGAFDINDTNKTVSLFVTDNNSQGTLIAKKLITVDASLQYITVDNGLLTLNNSQVKLNNSSIYYTDNITLQQINIPTIGVPNPVPKVAAVFQNTGNTDICGQLTVAGTAVFTGDLSTNKQLKTKDITASTINTNSLITPTITTNIGPGDKTDISSGGIYTKNITATNLNLVKISTTDISTTNISVTGEFTAPLLNITNATGKSYIKSDLTIGSTSTSTDNELFIYGSAVLGDSQTRLTHNSTASYIQAKSQVLFTKINDEVYSGTNRTLIVDTSNNRIAINRTATSSSAILDIGGSTNVSGILTTETLRVNNNDNHYILGQLGINTTNPNYTLDISGNTHISQGLIVDNSAIFNNTIKVSESAQFNKHVNISGQLYTDLAATFKNGVNVTGDCNINGIIKTTPNTSNVSSYIEIKTKDDEGRTPSIIMKTHTDGSLFKWYAWDKDNNNPSVYPPKSLELWGYPLGDGINKPTNKMLSIDSSNNTILLNTNTTINGDLYQRGTDLHVGYNNPGKDNLRGDTGQSRAIVKDNYRKLTINYGPQSVSNRATDFNGGTTIFGTTIDNYIKIEGGISMEGSNLFVKPSNSTDENAVKVELSGANLCIYKKDNNTNITNTGEGDLKLGIGNSSAVKGITINNDLISLNTNVHAEKNLTIGTSNAGCKLDVNGDTIIRGTCSADYILIKNNGNKFACGLYFKGFPTLSSEIDANTGIYSGGDGVLNIANNSSDTIQFTDSNVNIYRDTIINGSLISRVAINEITQTGQTLHIGKYNLIELTSNGNAVLPSSGTSSGDIIVVKNMSYQYNITIESVTIYPYKVKSYIYTSEWHEL